MKKQGRKDQVKQEGEIQGEWRKQEHIRVRVSKYQTEELEEAKSQKPHQDTC